MGDKSDSMQVMVNPGICGFTCVVEVHKTANRKISARITGSECTQIQNMDRALGDMTLRDLFAPMTRNPIFLSAERAGCHPSCIVPLALLKTAEAAMGMALPRDAFITFNP